MKRAKRVLAMFLVVCMICAVLPSGGYVTKVQAAEAEGITSGTTYIIKSAMNQDKAIMPTNSVPAWTYISMFDKTGSNSQKWLVEYNGSSYTIKNVGTGYNLHYGESVKDAHVDQNGYDGTDYYKWNLVKATSSNYPSGYMLEAVRKDGDGNPVYATASSSDNGTELYLRSKDESNPASQIWYFEQTDGVANSNITEDKVQQAAKAYLDKYLVDTTQSDGSTRKSLGGGFWIGAELCEMMLDGYETTGDNTYRSAFESSYQDLLNYIGNRHEYWGAMTETDWSANPFNDDVMWLVIASVRAHLMFGSSNNGYTDYLTYAKNNFQMAIDRGMLSDGTMRWTHEDGKGEGTTSCVNGPTVVAACYLAKATGDDSYYELARSVHAAQRVEMFNPETGQVYDSPSNEAPLTYNSGTWLGSCVMLYERYGDQQYLDDAVKTMDFLMKNNGRFCNGYGIITHEDSVEGDLSAFRAILMRYMRKFIVEMDGKVDMTKYIQWMQKNAKVAYNNQNSSGLILNPWFRAATNDVDYGSSGMSGGVSLLLNLPTYTNTVKKNAYERIEAEDFDYVKGVMTEGTQDSDGNRQIGGVQNGHYTGYANVQFGDKGAGYIELRVSTAVDGGYVEVRLDNPNGTLVGTVDLPYTQRWESYATASCDIQNVTGTHTVYLIYKNDVGSYVCNLNWIKFSEKSNYQVKYYTQNIDLASYTEVTEDGILESANVGATVVAPEKAYTGFTKNTEKSTESGIVVNDGSLVLNVYYDRNVYTINYEGIEDVTNKDALPSQYVYGIGATLQDPVKDGYTFDGWYSESSYENKRTSISTEEMGDITCYAKFIWIDSGEQSTTETLPNEGEQGTTESNPNEGEQSTTESNPDGGEQSTTESNPDGGEQSTTESNPDEGEQSTTESNPDSGEQSTTESKPDGGEQSTTESNPDEGEQSTTESNPNEGEQSTTESNPDEGEQGTTESNPNEGEQSTTESNPDEGEQSTTESNPNEGEQGTTENKPNEGEQGTTESNPDEGEQSTTESNSDGGEQSTEEKTDSGSTGGNTTVIPDGGPTGGNTTVIPDAGPTGGNTTVTPDNGGTTGTQPGTSDTNQPTNPGQSGGQDVTPATISKGETFVAGKFSYKVTAFAGTTGAVELAKANKKTYKSLTIPKSVKYKGITFKVTSIGKNAFKNNKKLKKITIGKEITTIGAKSFYGCKKLTTVKIKSKKLTKVGSKAFMKTNSKLKIKAGSKKYVQKYAKLLKKKMPKTAKVVK